MDIGLILFALLVLVIVVYGFGSENKQIDEDVSEDVSEDVVEGYHNINSISQMNFNGNSGMDVNPMILRDHHDMRNNAHSNTIINGDYGVEQSYGDCSGVFRPYGCKTLVAAFDDDSSFDNELENLEEENVLYPYSDKIHDVLDMVYNKDVDIEHSIITPHMNTFNTINEKEGDFSVSGNITQLAVSTLEEVVQESEDFKQKTLNTIYNGPEFSPANKSRNPDFMY